MESHPLPVLGGISPDVDIFLPFFQPGIIVTPDPILGRFQFAEEMVQPVGKGEGGLEDPFGNRKGLEVLFRITIASVEMLTQSLEERRLLKLEKIWGAPILEVVLLVYVKVEEPALVKEDIGDAIPDIGRDGGVCGQMNRLRFQQLQYLLRGAAFRLQQFLNLIRRNHVSSAA
jgi:hypothetical protein